MKRKALALATAGMLTLNLCTPAALALAQTPSPSSGVSTTVDTQAEQEYVSREIITVTASSYQPGYGPEKVIDGDESENNCWHTPWEGETIPGFPHWLQFEFQEEQTIDSLTYVARSATGYQFVTEYEIWVSDTGTQEKDFEKVAEGTWSRAKSVTAEFDPVTAKYVKFVALDKVDSNPGDTTSVSASEVKIGLADMTEQNRDAMLQPQVTRVEAALAFAEGDVGTGKGQFTQAAYDALKANQTKLKDMLGKNWSEAEALAAVKESEDLVQALLASSKVSTDEADAPAVPLGTIQAQDNTHADGYEGDKAIDGSLSTMWHNSWSPIADRPHNLTLDLGQAFTVAQVVITPRQDMASGYITKGEVWAGDSKDTMEKVTDFVGTGTAAALTVNLPLTQARFVEVRGTAGVDSHTAIAEIAVNVYDRGWVAAYNALDAAWFTADNASVGTQVGQFAQADLDAYVKELETFADEMSGKTNSAYYALVEEIRAAQLAFQAKAVKYTAQDLEKAIAEAQALVDQLEGKDQELLRLAIHEAQAALTQGNADQIHLATIKLLSVIKGLENATSSVVDLSGQWNLSLSGYSEGMECSDTVTLPGSLDENRKGSPDTYKNPNRLSRYFTYAGPATYERQVFVPHAWAGKQVNLYMERSRATTVYVNGVQVTGADAQTSSILPVAQQYNLGSYLQAGEVNTITIVVDNSYPNMPGAAITYSSTATEETQTNWNGILGRFELQIDESAAIRDVRVYPNEDLASAKVEVDIRNTGDTAASGKLTITVDGTQYTVSGDYTVEAGKETTVELQLPMQGAKLWSEHEPNLYTVQAALDNGSHSQVEFGMRDFDVSEDGRFTINGDYVFLRNEANCAVFPLTAYAPMDKESWLELFRTYQSYGLNSVRFHSWCPPEAAFEAADELGMYLLPELSSWDPYHMFADDIEKEYYRKEAFALIEEYANHPSFVAMTFGNELVFSGGLGSSGAQYADQLLADLKVEDSTRLYAGYSNGNYGTYAPLTNADFFTGQVYRGTIMRGIFAGMSGFINNERPHSTANYNEAVDRAYTEYQIPVFSFEVGQFQIFPDVLTELDDYTGVLEPRNLQLVADRLKEKGISDEETKKYIEASGMLSQLGYRMEFEAALRTNNFGGISLLGIQDFSGQGTALVGMMNALGDPKPYDFANPDTFRQWSSDVVALWETEQFCFTNDQTLGGKVLLVNYSADDLAGKMAYRLLREDGSVVTEGTVGSDDTAYAQGDVTTAGTLNISLEQFIQPTQLKLEISYGQAKNTYDIWVYPANQQVDERQVYVTGALDDTAKMVLETGGSVLLSPTVSKSTLPQSITGTFTTAFWSSIFVSESQPGSMGLLMDEEHPVFDGFPTQYHTNYQWWAMAKLGRPMILEGILDSQGNQIEPLVQVIDSFANIRTMGLLFEAKVGNGKLVVSSMGLDQNEGLYPEVRALKASILDYMNSEEFNPSSELTVDQIDSLVKGTTSVERKNLAEKSNGGEVKLAEGTYTCMDGYDKAPQDRALELNDGVVNMENGNRSWSDWNQNKNYPDVQITATLDNTYLVDTVNLPSYEDSGCKAPKEIRVEYWNGEKFVPVSNPSKTTGFVQGYNEITFDAVATNQIRFTFVHQDGMGLAISEIMVFEREIMPTDITVTGEDTVKVGDTAQFQAAFTPEDSTVTNVRWMVLDKEGKPSDLATISNRGVLTAKGEGTVVVRAMLVSNPAIYGEITVTIQKPVDKTQLNEAIEQAQAMVKNQDQYVQTNWKQLTDALAEALKVQADENAQVEAVEQATQGLKQAMEAQERKADKAALAELVKKAEGMDLTGYTAQSVEALREAVGYAKIILADETIGQKDQGKVDDAAAKLDAAIKGLVKEEEPGPSEEPGVSEKPDTQDKVEITVNQDKVETTVGDVSMVLENIGNVFAQGTVVTVEKVTQGTIFNTVKKALEKVVAKMEQTAIFEFTAKDSNGAAVQPDGTLTVTMAIPAHLSTSNLKMFYVSQDGKYDEVTITVNPEARTVTARLEHFSTYVLANVQPTQGEGVPDTGDANAMMTSMMVLVGASCLMGVAVLYRRRRSE